MAAAHMGGLKREVCEQELLRLQTELVKLQEWVKATGARLAVAFEGRDAAGKGSAIKRITEHLNPRVARIVALLAAVEFEPMDPKESQRRASINGPTCGGSSSIGTTTTGQSTWRRQNVVTKLKTQQVLLAVAGCSDREVLFARCFYAQLAHADREHGNVGALRFPHSPDQCGTGCGSAC